MESFSEILPQKGYIKYHIKEKAVILQEFHIIQIYASLDFHSISSFIIKDKGIYVFKNFASDEFYKNFSNIS